MFSTKEIPNPKTNFGALPVFVILPVLAKIYQISMFKEPNYEDSKLKIRFRLSFGLVWVGFELGLGWVLSGFGLGLGWVWVEFGLGLVASGCLRLLN